MSTLATQVRARRITTEFLQSLRARGRVLGVDDHQRVQELLFRLPADTEDATLGNALVALFASTPEEQRSLGRVFASALAITNQILAPAAAPDPEPDVAPPTVDEVKQATRDRRKLLWAALPLLLLALLAAIAYAVQPRTYRFDPQTLNLRVGEERELPGMDTVRVRIGDPQSFENIGSPPPAPEAISLRDGKLYYRAGDIARPDSARLLIHGTRNRRADVTFRFLIDTAMVTPDTQIVIEPVIKRATIDYDTLPLPYPRSLADLAPQPDTTPALYRFLYAWWWPLVCLFFVSCLVFLFFLLRYLHRRKQRLVARRDRLAGAPHFWRIRVPDAATAVDFGETYPLLLRQLRQRQEANHRELDVAATVRATIESGGLPTFAYKGTSRPAEYLLLIDRGGADNHRAQLFELLYQRLRDEEVLIERYFYDGDPRLLYQDDRAVSTTLPRLRDRLPNAQLVMVGTGDQLLNATNGKPAAWASKQLAAWGRPSLLTPRPHGDWGRRERRLDELLNILPATIQGLGLLTDRLTSADILSDGLTDYGPLLEDLIQEPVHFSGDLISSLREVYDEAKLKWIAACALYPSLHWELTLHLGAITGELAGRELLSSRNVLELCRLPWFVRGTIPEPARVVLTEWLRENHPEDERKLRAALLLTLNQADPPENSVADQELTFQRLQNEWMLAAPDSPERARAADGIAEAIEAGGVPDATVVKYLSEPLGSLDIPLDDKWKKRLYPGGLPGLGWRNWPQDLLFNGLVAIPFYLAFAALLSSHIPTNDACPMYVTGLSQDDDFRDLPTDTIAICSAEDATKLRDILFRHLIGRLEGPPRGLVWKDAITEAELGRIQSGSNELESRIFNFSGIDTLRNYQSAVTKLDSQVYANLSVAFYNRGVRLLDSTGAESPFGYILLNWSLKMNPENEAADILANYYETKDSTTAISRQKYLADGKEVQSFQAEIRRLLKNKGNWTIRTRDGEGFEKRVVALQTRMTTWEIDGRQLSLAGAYAPADDRVINDFRKQTKDLVASAYGTGVNRPVMQAIPAGTFRMGDTFKDNEEDDEFVHAISLSAFELARDELTFEEYDRYCDDTGVEKPDDEGWGRGRRPVINVSWFDAVKYCNWLSVQHGYDTVYVGLGEGETVTADWSANGYRLPTEAEWEYAAAYRPDGTKARFGNGKDVLRASEANFHTYADYKEPYSEVGDYREKTVAVGSFSGNDRGLRDMAGNVLEWCWDWYGVDYYGESPRNNPKGPGAGTSRVLRGGGWNYYPSRCRAAYRNGIRPENRTNYVGFRLARGLRGG